MYRTENNAVNPEKLSRKVKSFGFTLVELVVVITILAILGTIGFLSIQGYSASARDGARISNLSNLQKGLTLWKVVAGTFPMPEDAVTLTASGVTIGYQGFARDRVGGMAKLSPGSTRDPLDS
jgi:prepilin-type N-terminal cleavage/methylation domain-containing protein